MTSILVWWFWSGPRVDEKSELSQVDETVSVDKEKQQERDPISRTVWT